MQVNLVQLLLLPPGPPLWLEGREIILRRAALRNRMPLGRLARNAFPCCNLPTCFPGVCCASNSAGFSRFCHKILLVFIGNKETHAEDIKRAPSALQGRKVRTGHFRGTTLFRRCLAAPAFMSANTPEPCNGSTRRLLLSFLGTFHHHGSRGSFGLALMLACTNRQFSLIAACPTFLAQCLCI